MRILVTGAHGLLGRALSAAARDTDEVVGCGRGELDVTDPEAVRAALRRVRPDAVVHAAGHTRVDDCEAEPERAWAVNAEAAGNVARACAEISAPLLALSTDYVFDGRGDRPYTEGDAVDPQSVYGRTKAAGEQLVRESCAEHYIVRTAWLQGAQGRCFVTTMLRMAAAGAPIRVVSDQIGSPTFADDLAVGIRDLLDTGRHGTYHLTNSGACSWYDLARAAFAEAGVAVEVEPIRTADYATPAQRPAYSVLDNTAARQAGVAPLPAWQNGLARLVRGLRP